MQRISQTAASTHVTSLMLRRDHWLILGLALIARVLAALPQAQPNYMDAAYYTVGGQRLVQGLGFSDPYVWNYLDQPTTLPHPSHLYWMPLPSILVAVSQSIFGINYRAAQLPFVLLSAVLPIIAYAVAWQVSASRRHAWLAALLTIFSGFYLPYWGVPESFTPFAVFGALAIYGSADHSSTWKVLAAGACAGLAHLSRADGVLLLIPVFGLAYTARPARSFKRDIAAILLGYVAVTVPWFARNVGVIGAPLSSAGLKAAWLCNYDERFLYDVPLDFNHLLGCGIDHVVLDKLNSLASGLIHLMAEDGMIFLAPLMAVGLWRSRRHRLIRGASMYLVLLFFTMSIVFTFAGDRGGLFHSSGALLPFLFAAAPIGLDALIGWIAAWHRTWNAAAARSVFGASMLGLAVVLSVGLWRSRVIGSDLANPVWNQASQVYQSIGLWLSDRGAAGSIVMVNDPPDFFYQTHIQAIVIPDGDVTTLLAAADRFGAGWLILDENHARGLDDFYAGRETHPRLTRVTDFGSTIVYQIRR